MGVVQRVASAGWSSPNPGARQLDVERVVARVGKTVGVDRTPAHARTCWAIATVMACTGSLWGWA